MVDRSFEGTLQTRFSDALIKVLIANNSLRSHLHLVPISFQLANNCRTHHAFMTCNVDFGRLYGHVPLPATLPRSICCERKKPAMPPLANQLSKV